tara:strand:+ start:2897 stop:3415 length:519 start_codon:yes stop_codon:yes gene_type:complete
MDIKEHRQAKHLSQEHLAELSGLSLRTIQRAESGYRISYASLRALAATFEINADELERELFSMDKIITMPNSYPLWVRFFLGRGWLTATRKELLRTEIFFAVTGLVLGAAWLVTSAAENPISRFAMLGSLCAFLGAYKTSISIRLGDSYDAWSKLESTIPRGWFGFRSYNNR